MSSKLRLETLETENLRLQAQLEDALQKQNELQNQNDSFYEALESLVYAVEREDFSWTQSAVKTAKAILWG